MGFRLAVEEPERNVNALDFLDVVVVLECFGKQRFALEVILEGCDSRVQAPKSGSWLKKYEYKVVQGTKKSSKAIYLRLRPEKDGAARGGGNHLNVLYNGTEVVVLARQDGYSLVLVEPGYVGWVISNGLVSK